MLYHLVRPVARYVLRYYYRNIDLTGLEHIPPNAAVILAANHPTAFIEPCILACFQPRTLWFLARGNLFKNGFFTALLNAVNILPVYRLEDGGYEKLKDNFDTFDACYAALSKQRAIMILAEGRCIHEKNLRPLRKGTARIALGALDRDSTLNEVYIVPVGCNFTSADRVRGQVLIRCGEPILASAYLDDYRRGEATAIKNLTSHLRARLSPLVVQFPDQERADIGEARLQLDRNDQQAGLTYGITHDGEQLDRELEIAATTPPEAPLLTRYFNRLQLLGLSDGAVPRSSPASSGPPAERGSGAVPRSSSASSGPPAERGSGAVPRSSSASSGPPAERGSGAVAGAGKVKGQGDVPWAKVFLAGLFQLPQLPLWLLAYYLGLSRPKHVEFNSPVRFAVVAGGTFLLYPLLLLLLPWLAKIWLLVAVFTVGWSLRQLEKVGRWAALRRVAQLVPEERSRLKQWREASYEECLSQPQVE